VCRPPHHTAGTNAQEASDCDENKRRQHWEASAILMLPLKNYITPAGFQRLQDERARLWKVERPAIVATVAWAAGNGDRSENGDYIYGKRKLREIDRRIRYLSKSLDSAVVVDNSGKTHDRVYFGATVTFVHQTDGERVVTIVGVDELDSGSTRVSWRSPLARALLKARVGDVVTVRSPRGLERLEILAIQYGPDGRDSPH
jgi:transcription elongation factor GreB